MNAKRLPYFALTKVKTPTMGYPSLCHFCKYAKWIGDCNESDLECQHPLGQGYGAKWDSFAVWAGDDCWGFRPAVDIDEAADMVGIWLNSQRIGVRL